MVNIYEKLQAVEFDKLPKSIQGVYLAPPVISMPIEPDGDGFKLLNPGELDRPAPQALVPKLGIKSWRDAGRLGVIYEGMNMRKMAEKLLKHPTQPQCLAASAWTETKSPLRLHLSPYVDFSEVSEVRFLADQKQCRRISACLRGSSAPGLSAALPQLASFAANIAAHLPPHGHIIDVGYFPSGDVWLVEINPGLTPQDLAVLQKE